MHEVSVAQSIIDIAEANAHNQNASAIQKVKVRLGEFTTIVPEALEFAFEVARRGTMAEHAVLEIEFVRLVTRCALCGEVREPMQQISLHCSHCGLPLEIVAGEELQLDYIEIT
jgi:hydrogenase nickel incorporation protein HypA/HybF